jgi:hypothetical protein
LGRKRLKEIPGMRNNPQKDKEQEKVKKAHKNFALAAKKRDFVGVWRRKQRTGPFIVTVGSPSEW